MKLHDYYFANPYEKPLDNLVEDGGFARIFRKIAIVGDSLASGTIEAYDDQKNNLGVESLEYAWSQYISNICGNTIYNFSRGGMSAREYCETYAQEKGYWDKEKAAQAYVLALGINDILVFNMDIGSISDICLEDYTKNKPTFIGYYAQIIQRYKEIQPHAKFFLVTMVDDFHDEWIVPLKNHRDALYALAELFDNTYVIDLLTYLPKYSEAFWNDYGLHGHMNPMGYVFTGRIIVSYMDYIIRHNMKAFRQVAFIGTPSYDKSLDT